MRRPDPGVVFLFVGLHAILMFNALVHPPEVGYDAGAYIAYIESLSEGQLPAPRESSEFFTPPLPFIVPAAVTAVARESGIASDEAARRGGKSLQLLNVLLSMLLVLHLLRLCELMAPGDAVLKRLALGLLASMPVYYKSFAMVRAEPMLAALCVVFADFALRSGRLSFSTARAAFLGALFGAAALSRQWAMTLVPAALAAWTPIAIRRPVHRPALIRTALVAGIFAVLVGGWFYVHLDRENGTPLAFNRSPAEERWGGVEGFLDLAWPAAAVRAPVRPEFNGRALPILYSEFWGDYWAYFLVWGRTSSGSWRWGPVFDTALEPPRSVQFTNRSTIRHYLARVNLLSTIPSLILAAGLLAAIFAAWKPSMSVARGDVLRFALVFLLASVALYVWFVMRYPNRGIGDTVKATYLLQTLPFVALLVGERLSALGKQHRWVFRLAVALWVVVGLHNVPTFFTHYR